MGVWFFVVCVKFCKAIINEIFSLVKIIGEFFSLINCIKKDANFGHLVERVYCGIV